MNGWNRFWSGISIAWIAVSFCIHPPVSGSKIKKNFTGENWVEAIKNWHSKRPSQPSTNFTDCRDSEVNGLSRRIMGICASRILAETIVRHSYWAINAIATGGGGGDLFLPTLPEMLDREENRHLHYCSAKYSASKRISKFRVARAALDAA